MESETIQFPGNVIGVSTIADLRAVASYDARGEIPAFVAGGIASADGSGGIYVFVPGSLAVDDGNLTVKPNDITPLQAGRWVLADRRATPSSSTFATKAQLQAARTGDVAAYVRELGGTFVWTPGDYTGCEDENVVASGVTPLMAGAWVRQGVGRILPLGFAGTVRDDGPQLQALLNAGSYTLGKRVVDYQTGQQLFVPNSPRRILHKPGVTFKWVGDTAQFSGLYVCRYTSTPVLIGVDGDAEAGDRWFVNASKPAPVSAPLGTTTTPKHLFYPVLVLSADNVNVNGITTNGILGIVGPGESRLYSKVLDVKGGAYVGPGVIGDNRMCHNIHFADCDGGFAEYTDANEFLYFNFTDGWSARRIRASNVTQGIVWWGGDSQGPEGGIGTPRLNRNGTVSDCLVDGVAGAGIWGSMGQRIRVSHSEVRYCGDVGFDCEGGVDVQFIDCTADNAVNGTFTIYYQNDGVTFDNPVSFQDLPGARHLAPWSAGDSNKNLRLVGGYFKNRNGIGSVGDEPSRVNQFIIGGSPYLEDVIYRPYAQGSGATVAGQMRIVLTRKSGAAAILAGNNETPRPTIILDGITIESQVPQDNGWAAVQINDSSNAPFQAVVRNLTVRAPRVDGTDAPIVCTSLNKNGDASSNFTFIGNTGVSAITVTQTNAVPVNVGGGLNFNSLAQPVTATLIPYVAP